MCNPVDNELLQLANDVQNKIILLTEQLKKQKTDFGRSKFEKEIINYLNNFRSLMTLDFINHIDTLVDGYRTLGLKLTATKMSLLYDLQKKSKEKKKSKSKKEQDYDEDEYEG